MLLSDERYFFCKTIIKQIYFFATPAGEFPAAEVGYTICGSLCGGKFPMWFTGSKKGLHLVHIGLLGLYEPCGQLSGAGIAARVVVQVLCALGDSHGVALNDHLRDF